MTQALKMLQRGGLEATPYVDDVFSTYLYTGNGSTQTITNGIDLAGKGGMVWIKDRSDAAAFHRLQTTEGTGYRTLYSNSTSYGGTLLSSEFSFLSDGFSMNIGGGDFNASGKAFTSWTFRKAPKFFDVQTATLASGNATVSFSGLSTLGMVIVKRTDSTGSWYVWHRSLTAGKLLYLEQSAAEATLGHITVSGTTLTLVDGTLADGNYVCYGFAHDTATDGIIQCGSYSGNDTSQSINLGWEPQFVITKVISGGTGSWRLRDVMRGFDTTTTHPILYANLSDAESSTSDAITPTATGFNVSGTSAQINGSGYTYIYLAIRRPNKPPTTGTQVFQPTVYTGTNADNRHLDTTIAPDMVWLRKRNGTVFGGMLVGDRLRGQAYLATGTTAAEVSDADSLDQQLVSAVEYGTAFSSMSGIYIGNDATADINLNTTASNHVVEAFKRAPGVFDATAFTDGAISSAVPHNLGVAPELVILKKRSATDGWYVITPTYYLYLNTTAAKANNTTTLGVTTMNLASYTSIGDFVVYLFATKAGISKVGSYTGNGSSQTIDCGFTTGARFVLIKRTDSTGDWFVFDTARGIVAGNDPFLYLNSTAAEITTVDALDPANEGFIVNQDATYNLNVNTATYIYLAFA
jgi:hypothetical protein